MNTQILEYIIVVANEKSLAKAAESFHISQPALSKQVKKLEKTLGTSLFVRSPSGMTLTKAGEIYVASAKEALAIYNKTIKEIKNL